MKRIKLLTVFLIVTQIAFSQIGINNNDPKATFDVMGKPSEIATADGVIAPRISRQDLIAKTAYSSGQTGAIVYVKDLTGTINTATLKIIEIGYYYFDGSVWQSMNSGDKFSFGDLKSGFQSIDHNGWIKLDGRSINTLSGTQQAIAVALGFGTNLPNATNSYLVQNGTSLGSVSGNNSRTISQTNLPDVNLIASSAGLHNHNLQSAGDHAHTISRRSNPDNVAFDPGDGKASENSAATTDRPILGTFNTSSTGAHTHNVENSGTHIHTVPLGGSGMPLDISPQSLSVNTFIYLGK